MVTPAWADLSSVAGPALGAGGRAVGLPAADSAGLAAAAVDLAEAARAGAGRAHAHEDISEPAR